MKRIVLFGSGEIGERVYGQLKDRVLAFIDNDKSKQCQKKFGIVPIISLNEYKCKYAEVADILVCSSRYGLEMIQQLEENGIHNYAVAQEVWKQADVVQDEDISHDNWTEFLVKKFDIPGNDILEIGSRNERKTWAVGMNCKDYFTKANYFGFDYYEGENVDVVGDAHLLSNYFDQKFDLIFSSAVFEHLAMPWKVSLEIIKCLKVGGCVFIETQYSYSRHAEPWHFFQFSENALNVLFPEKFGMRCIKKGCCNLIKGCFSEEASNYLQGRFVHDLYGHSEILLQKIKEIPIEQLSWDNVSLQDVVGATRYPKKNGDFI